MAMRTKVLVFVGLLLVSVLGISAEITFRDQEMYHSFSDQYSLNAKIFDYGQNIVSIEINTKGKGKNIQNKQINRRSIYHERCDK